MAKKKEKPHRAPTKRQLSHWQKERRRQRLIFITGIVVIAAVVCALIAGYFVTQYIPMHQVVLKVNDREFKMNYYINMLVFYGGDNVAGMVDSVSRVIQQNEKIRQDTARLGITVSDSEINEALNEQDPPISKKYKDIVRAQLLVQKMSDEYFDEQVPTSSAQRHVFAMLLESENQASDIKERLDDGEEFETLAEEFSLNSYTKTRKGDLGWRPEGIVSQLLGSMKVEQYAFGAEAGDTSDPIFDDTISKKVGYWILKVLEKRDDPEEAHVYGILLGSEEEAQKARERLDAGEEFGALAGELSQHTDSKDAEGEMGWVARETVSEAVADYAFSEEVQIDKLSDIIRDDTAYTEGGYWLVKLAEIEEDRPLEEENRNILKNGLMSEWATVLESDPYYVVEDFLDPDKQAYAVEQAEKIIKKQAGTR